ncbi:MAG TPA: LCCL domain-containing protein, partial [Gemmatimonadota bacterium]|nr:LCCL domain-containing protein [Gemmatimonadota bacterium]
AVHAGLITLAGGGTVTIEMRGGEASYRGEDRNGITSWNYGAWGSSFVVPRPGDPPARPPSQAGAPAGAAAEAPAEGAQPPTAGAAETPAAGGPPTPLGGSSSWLTSLQASWIGLDADLVTNGAETRPDGSPDGHFRVDAAFSFWQDVTYIAVQSADEAGSPAGGQMWHSQNSSYWLLAVLVDGMNLNARHVPLLGGFTGDVTFDLYAGNSGWFRPGQRVLVELGLGSGQAVTRLVQIGGEAPATPPAAGAPSPPSAEAPSPPPAGAPAAAPPAVAGTPTAGPVDWNTRGESHRGEVGTRYTYTCPPNGTAGPVWGTDVYTDDSSVCTAAVHAGLITLAGGGTVTIEMRGGEASYRGEDRNGITSWNYGAWGSSFVFPRPGDPPAAAANALRGPEICGVWRWFDRSVVVFDAEGGLAATGVNAPSLMLVDRGRWELADAAGRQYRISWPVGQDLLTLSPDQNSLGGTNVGGAVQVTATRTGACGAPPPSPPGDFDAHVSYGAEWIGMDADFVGVGGSGSPDGAADGHFTFTVDSDIGPYEIRSIAVVSSDAAGNASGGQVWHSANSSYWLLGVSRQGVRLNDGPVPSLGTHQGFSSFDLYAADSGWFQPGQHFVVEVDMGGGTPIRQVVRIPESFQPDVQPQAEPAPAEAPPAEEPAPPAQAPEPPEAPAAEEPPMGADAAARPQRDSYLEGETIVVDFRGFPGYAQDWIEISPAGASDESYGQWFYLGGQTAGSLQFSGLAPGTYEVRGRFNWPDGGYVVRTQSTFTVVSNQPPVEPPVEPSVEPPAEPYRVTGLSAAWIGVDADVVSTVTVSPDGAPDGHFAIDMTIEGSPLVSYATVYSSDASGNPYGGQIWHTQSTSYAVLAVAGWGHFLNTGYVSEIGRFPAGATRLDLYVFDSGWFRPGQHFVVELGFADGQKVSRVVEIAGAAPPPPAPQQPAAPPANQYRVTGLSLTWIGMDADVVSVGTATVPDGAADGRFRVDVTIEGSVELRSVTLYSSNAQGNPEGGQVWTTASGTSWWVLGVGAGGSLLHNGQVEGIGVLQAGTTWLDLFAGNSGWFNPGQSFLVELAFADGQKAAQVVRIPDSFVPPGAAPPVSPEGQAAGGAPGACDVSGLWHGNIQGFGASDWTFTATGRDLYAVQETGLGNAQGTAIVSGYTLQFDWRTGDFTGTAMLGLDASCTSASGQDILHTGAPGAYPMTLQRAGAAPPAGGGEGPAQVFSAPMWNGLRVDICLVWGGQCGEPAATEFCRQSGYTKATAWEPAYDIGAQTPTFVLGTGQTCSEAGCDGFTSITCTR